MANDAWETPQWLFDWLWNEYGFNLDIAHNGNNCKLCKSPWSKQSYVSCSCEGYTEDYNALETKWKFYYDSPLGECRNKGRVFCNPPFSNPLPWITKAIAEIKLGNCELAIFILPADMTTQWAKLCIDHASRIIHITGYYSDEGKFHSGRINFDAPEGVKSSSNNKGTMIVEFRELHAEDFNDRCARCDYSDIASYYTINGDHICRDCYFETQYVEIKEIMG